MARTANSNDDPAQQRWLCSHLVEIEFDDDRFAACMGVMEEIEAESAAIGMESPYPVGARLRIKAGPYEVPAEIIFRLPRETDFLVWARFCGGQRWSPELWKPDHLYLPPQRKKKLRRAAGRNL